MNPEVTLHNITFCHFLAVIGETFEFPLSNHKPFSKIQDSCLLYSNISWHIHTTCSIIINNPLMLTFINDNEVLET